MSAAAVVLPVVLPYVWAVARSLPRPAWPFADPILPAPRIRRPARLHRRELAFYRQYTEAMLRRYVRMSMEAGKVPSLIGQELLPGNRTTCRVDRFDDVVIYLHDVDRCIDRLSPQQQLLIRRVAIQQFSVNDTAVETGLNQRTVISRYGWALDRLTEVFLQVKLLEPRKFCQEGKSV